MEDETDDSELELELELEDLSSVEDLENLYAESKVSTFFKPSVSYKCNVYPLLLFFEFAFTVNKVEFKTTAPRISLTLKSVFFVKSCHFQSSVKFKFRT